MTIAKAYGRVAEFKGDNARIQVLTFRRQGKFVHDENEIKQMFPGHGYVFAPKWLERFRYPIGTLVEFHVSNRTSDKGDVFLVDITKECKQVGFPIFYSSRNILFNEWAINQPVLKDVLGEWMDSSHFYIIYEDVIYGPFKKNGNQVLPRLGTTVNKFESVPEKYECEGAFYILHEPKTVIGQLDCMTLAQLGVFLKDQLRNLDLRSDALTIKSALEKQRLDGLDSVRINRVIYSLDQLELNCSTIKQLSNESDVFYAQYNKALELVRDELKSEILEPLIERKASISNEVERLSEKVKVVAAEYAEILDAVNKAKTELNFIYEEKMRLIGDIRVQSLVKSLETDRKGLLTFEEKIYHKEGIAFDSLSEFADLMQAMFVSGPNRSNYLAHNIVYQLAQHKCFLTKKIDPVLLIARLSSNCKLVIQQVEADWIKFDRFYFNGLKQIWFSAHRNTSMFHFLVLEDVNMASFECYGRPLLDLISGVRSVLPDQGTCWPDNLWIFGLPLSPELDKEFGLPLLRPTFQNWGFLPDDEFQMVNGNQDTNKVLHVSQIYDHDIFRTSSFIDQYFPEE